jgi:small subunit ribosomal protein S17|uniref:Small ribosomal subunit protein uS17c n=1 Tax=Thalassiosira nordenskioeldii TaxID=83372 RepID=A0A8K1YGF7_THANO|nr:ribosomal protein S17 [Thalassiosira nordenskioeldii]UBQ35024.1 ribosomal protein S17 [Thalassiosira nordenskioeldii]
MPVKEKIGIVVSNKMQKTVVVKVESRYPHPMYSKTMIKTRKYFAHDEMSECNIGDQVLVTESRPRSKKKRWSVTKIMSKSSLIT